MRQLEEENLRLKKRVADLSPDKAMLQDVLAKKELVASDDSALRLRIWDITETRLHYDYRRVHVTLRREG